MLSRLCAAVALRGTTLRKHPNSIVSTSYPIAPHPFYPSLFRTCTTANSPVNKESPTPASSKHSKSKKQSTNKPEAKRPPRRKPHGRGYKRQRRPKHMCKESKGLYAKWPALKLQYGQTLPQALEQKSLQEAQSLSLVSAIRSICFDHAQPVQMICDVVKATQKWTRVSGEVFDLAMKAIIERVLKDAQAQKEVAMLSSEIDLGIETLFRCMQVFGERPGLHVLTHLIQMIKVDECVDLRAARALSIFRFVRGMQMKASAEFVYECFQACIEGVDVESGAILMEHALENDLCEEREIDYYNGIMHAAILREDYNTASVAHEELLQKGVEPNSRTENLFLALCLERDDDHSANILLGALKRKSGKLDDVTVAALIRRHGRKRDVKQVLKSFWKFEVGGGDVHARNVEGERRFMVYRSDPVYSAFYALRACSAAAEAVELAQHLRNVHGVELQPAMMQVVMETCWRAGRLDLARAIRGEVDR